MSLKNQIFDIKTDKEFNEISLEIFNYQYTNNLVYHKFCNHLNISPQEVNSINQIPFLPIELFKTNEIKTGDFTAEHVFLSSGTTGQQQSKHYVKDLDLYKKSFTKCFEQFYGKVEDYCIMALLPSYLEQKGSSLVFMVDQLIKSGNHQKSGFFVDKWSIMIKNLQEMVGNGQKTILIGVSFAILGLAEKHQIDLNSIILMETGGMKGRREELTREQLHQILCKSYNTKVIHSEYGMTELLSQAYSSGNGIFKTPPWMKVLIRDINDPFQIFTSNKSGGINVIDLANIDSCCFIATQDLGRNTSKGFEVLGRFDNSDLRGCNLLVS